MFVNKLSHICGSVHNVIIALGHTEVEPSIVEMTHNVMCRLQQTFNSQSLTVTCTQFIQQTNENFL